jgi:hypothetical protein
MLKTTLTNGLDDPQGRGRHPALDDASEIEIVEWIQNQAEKFNPVTRTDLLHHCHFKYFRFISRRWVNYFILRHRDDPREVTSVPQKYPRLEVPWEFLDETTRDLREYIHGMKVELAFNLDKMGMSEWEDRKEKKGNVPMRTDGQMIHHGASRSVKNISVIAYISAGGESLTPVIMTSQISDGIHKRLINRGFRFAIDFVLRQRSKPDVSRKLFREHVKTIFRPYWNELWDSEECEACESGAFTG